MRKPTTIKVIKEIFIEKLNELSCGFVTIGPFICGRGFLVREWNITNRGTVSIKISVPCKEHLQKHFLIKGKIENISAEECDL